MIRFSAALVAVAIGVLIGGIATSKLLLVYIAIVVSAVALVALAIGVVIKREELFGEGQGLVPAGAGAAPVRPARTGESQDQHHVAADRQSVSPGQHSVATGQQSPAVSVPPPAPFPGPAGHGTAFGGAAFGETAQAARPAAAPQSAANPPAPPQSADAYGRNRAGDAVPPWAAQSARDQWSSPPWPGSTAASPAPDWMASGHGASDQAGTTASALSPTAPPPVPAAPPPVPAAPPTVPAAPPVPSAPSSAGSAPASPNWFAPKARPAEAVPPATEVPPEAPAAAAPADEDDDWPTRYSWLDDEADKSPGAADAPAGGTSSAQTAASAAADARSELPGPETEPEPGAAEPETSADGGEPPSAGRPGPAQAAHLVTVLPGVPRYHQPDCVLIRFMPDDEVQRLPVAQAKADGCTPCAACQPAD